MQIVNTITQYYLSFFKVLRITLQVIVISLLCATVLGAVFGLFEVSSFKVPKLAAGIYTDIIRGTSLLVQVMIMMYGVGSVLKPYDFQRNNIGGTSTAGCVALGLNAGAYMVRIIRGGIEVVDKGQIEVARSLGLSYGKATRKATLPQAFRTMLLSIINQFIISLKGASLVSVIEPRELARNGKITAANPASMATPIWICMALFCLVACTILSRIAKHMERRASYGK